MNVDFYIFGKQEGEYIQYVDDSTKNIFQNVVLQTDEQLSIYHNDFLIYYIYTKNTSYGYIGFVLVFNNAIYTDIANIYEFFRDINTQSFGYSLSSIISNEEFINNISKQIEKKFNNSDKFIESGKPIHNFISDKKDNEKIFDSVAGIDTNKHFKIKAITEAIKQYQWVYIIENHEAETQIIHKKTKNITDTKSKGYKLFIILGIVIVFVTIFICLVFFYKTKSQFDVNTPSATPTEEEKPTEEEAITATPFATPTEELEATVTSTVEGSWPARSTPQTLPPDDYSDDDYSDDDYWY